MCPCVNHLNSLIQLLPLNLWNVFDLPMSLGCCEDQMRECMVKCFVNYKAQYTYVVLWLGGFWPGCHLDQFDQLFWTDLTTWASNKRYILKWAHLDILSFSLSIYCYIGCYGSKVFLCHQFQSFSFWIEKRKILQRGSTIFLWIH